MKSHIAVLLPILLLTALAVATGEWARESSSSSGGFSEADVGAVDGWVGALEGFQTSESGDGFTTTGTVGTVWNGEQYEYQNETQVVEKVNSATHVYEREQGGPATRSMSASIDSEVSVSGSAQQKLPSDPQWWWNTTSSIDFLGVVTMVLSASTNEWSEIAPANYPEPNWPSGGCNDGGAGSAGDAPNNNQPAGTSAMAFTNSPTTTTDSNGWYYETNDDKVKIKMTATWKSQGRPASIDNAKVRARNAITYAGRDANSRSLRL